MYTEQHTVSIGNAHSMIAFQYAEANSYKTRKRNSTVTLYHMYTHTDHFPPSTNSWNHH